jgi:hypothetical protein
MVLCSRRRGKNLASMFCNVRQDRARAANAQKESNDFDMPNSSPLFNFIFLTNLFRVLWRKTA